MLVLPAAACSAGGEQSSDEDLVSVGTEAWVDIDPQATALPPDSADPTNGDPTDGDPTDGDPTDGDPLDEVGQTGPATPPDAPATGTAEPVDPSQDVAAIVQAMTLEQKVGQLFTVPVIGDDATQPSQSAQTSNLALYGVASPAEVVARYHLGGVAYFDHDQGPGTSNVADLTRTAALSAGLQSAAAADSGIGLLIGTDQEGGPVVRLREPAVVFPSARDIASTGDTDLARQAGAVTGSEALAVGVNWVYAPVADVNVDPANPVIGDRAFGATATGTLPFVRATAEGLAAAGVLPTLKHFPGHGDTQVDSHNSLPTLDQDRATLDSVDFPPFAEAASLDPVSVMVGHLAVPAIDPTGVPATISGPIISTLREELGFDRLVVTDAMNMGALQGFGDSGTLAVDAINAGIDMILLPVDLPLAWNTVLAAVQDGRITQERLDEAVTRVLQAKQSIGALDASAVPAGDPTRLGSAEALAVLDAITAACAC